MIQCIAIDDEPLALEIIKKYCSETPLVKLENTFTDAIQALAWLKVKKTDLIILDIQMPDISGIQLITSLKEPPMVIFTTAFPQSTLFMRVHRSYIIPLKDICSVRNKYI